MSNEITDNLAEEQEIDNSRFEAPISELNLSNLISVDLEMKLEDLVNLLQEKNIGAVTITENEKLVGIITERDMLLKVVGVLDNWREISVKEVMTEEPKCLTEDVSIATCIKLICFKEFRHIPIVDENQKPIKMLSIKDILKFIVDLFPNQVEKYGTKTDWEVMAVDIFGENFSFKPGQKKSLTGNAFLNPLKKAINPNRALVKVPHTYSIQDVLKEMQEKKVGYALIMNYETELYGIITERDFLFKIFGKLDLTKGPISVDDFITSPPHTLLQKHFFAFAINNMFKYKYRNIILVDEDRIPVSVITLLDIFKYIGDFLDIEDE